MQWGLQSAHKGEKSKYVCKSTLGACKDAVMYRDGWHLQAEELPAMCKPEVGLEVLHDELPPVFYVARKATVAGAQRAAGTITSLPAHPAEVQVAVTDGVLTHDAPNIVRSTTCNSE